MGARPWSSPFAAVLASDKVDGEGLRLKRLLADRHSICLLAMPAAAGRAPWASRGDSGRLEGCYGSIEAAGRRMVMPGCSVCNQIEGFEDQGRVVSEAAEEKVLGGVGGQTLLIAREEARRFMATYEQVAIAVHGVRSESSPAEPSQALAESREQLQGTPDLLNQAVQFLQKRGTHPDPVLIAALSQIRLAEWVHLKGLRSGAILLNPYSGWDVRLHLSTPDRSSPSNRKLHDRSRLGQGSVSSVGGGFAMGRSTGSTSPRARIL
jgi:hypothetical protein